MFTRTYSTALTVRVQRHSTFAVRVIAYIPLGKKSLPTAFFGRPVSRDGNMLVSVSKWGQARRGKEKKEKISSGGIRRDFLHGDDAATCTSACRSVSLESRTLVAVRCACQCSGNLAIPSPRLLHYLARPRVSEKLGREVQCLLCESFNRAISLDSLTDSDTIDQCRELVHVSADSRARFA